MNNQFTGSDEERKEKASAPILSALKLSRVTFNEWDASCHAIDDIYSRSGSSYERIIEMAGNSDWTDAQLDIFWASSEVLKPAVYARAPIPAVSPMFNDGGKLKTTAAEILERAAVSTFRRTAMNDVMELVRDDLLFSGRGVMWMRYEDDGGKKVCAEHLDRDDFLHEPARKWTETGWVAGGFWMTRDEMKVRFKDITDEQLDEIKFLQRRDDQTKAKDTAMEAKARVWEVWHRANNRVYWVTEGLDVYLDDDTPHLDLEGFFPCPRPAYGTLRRRTLIPVPDFERFAVHFSKINTLTARIYLLLDQVRMKGIIPGGGDVADAIEQLMRSDDDSLLIAVPGAAMMEGAAAVVWLPLNELAQAITGLIEARRQLIDDFYQLSGISDIMRGATDAQETLGAQRLKSQYGSVRVRSKIDELQRVAADAVKIASEIIAEQFDGETLLEMAQMELPTAKELKKRIAEIEKGAEAELKALADKAQEAVQQQGQEIDPAQAEQMLQQAQQQIISKYSAMLEEAENTVPIDDVVTLLRDDRTRSFAFEIETDSTILTDEMAEKQARSEFMNAFNGASQSLMSLASMGEGGAKLAGEMFKFALAPYRAGRQMNAAIEDFVEQAPSMAATGDDGGLAEAQGKLAEAEMEKAKAAMAGVQAKSMLDKAEMQRKIMDMQQKAQEQQQKSGMEAAKLRGQLAETQSKLDKTDAEIDKIRAQTAEILENIGLDVRKQELSEYQAAENSQSKQVEQIRTAQRDQIDDQYRERGEARADQQIIPNELAKGDL